MTDAGTDQSTKPPSAELDREMERYRKELTGYCYRMLGSAFEAEDAVQETMIRAWRAYDRFEGRSSLRSWLYRIATNVCLDSLKGRKRRAVPMDFGPASTAADAPPPPLPESAWVEPAPDGRVLPERDDPADVAIARESIRLAFVAALQHLPPRQRAVLILREVLRWRASEVATLLETTEASVNSALQRARATFATHHVTEPQSHPDVLADHAALLARYVEAFEQYDMETLVTLLHEDATQTMPPFNMWLRGAEEIVAFMVGPGAACRGSRLVPIEVNGVSGFGQYKPSPDGGYTPWAVQVHDIVDGRFQGLNFFLDTERLFPLFGLPPRLP